MLKNFKLCYKLYVAIFIIILSTSLISCTHKLNQAKKRKPTVELIIKTPIFNMSSIVDSKINDVYSFLKKVASDFVAQYNEANVTISITQYSNEKRFEAVRDTFGTPEATDMIWCDINDYIYTCHAVPLDDILDDIQIRNDIDSNCIDFKTIQGHLYTMPFQAMQMVLCYNKDLFRHVGLTNYISKENIVQNWSYSQWDEILSTLAKKLPNNCYPMMMYAENEQGDSNIMLLLRCRGAKFFDSTNHFNLSTKEGILGLQLLQVGAEKKYFPPTAENLQMLDCYELFCSGQLAIYCANMAIEHLFRQAGINCGFVNFPYNNTGIYALTMQGFQIFDNGDQLKIKVAKDFLRYIYKSDYLDYSMAGIPISRKVKEKYKDKLKDNVKYINNTGIAIDTTGNNPNWNAVRAVFHTKIQDLLLQIKTPQEIAKEIDAECNAAIDIGHKETQLHK